MFKIGDVVHVYSPNLWEMVSWRNETGALVESPPEVDMTVVEIIGATFVAAWFQHDELKTDTFAINDFYKVQ